MDDLKKSEELQNASGNAGESREPAVPGRFPNRGGNHLWTGLFILGIGVVLLLRQLGVPFPAWLFSWPMILLLIGLYIGFKHRFNNFAWAVIVLIGVALLIDQEASYLKISQYVWPLVIIAIGLLIMSGARSRRRRGWERWKEWREMRNSAGGDDWKSRVSPGSSDAGGAMNRRQRKWERWKEWEEMKDKGGWSDWRSHANWRNFTAGAAGEDFLDSTCVFGGVRKVVLSKDFKGGDITNLCGGSEIDLTQADIKGTVRMDVTQVFGGTKIIVPAHWEVKSEMVAIFGGIEDKRRIQAGVADPEKILLLEGTSIFGGIEIRSY